MRLGGRSLGGEAYLAAELQGDMLDQLQPALAHERGHAIGLVGARSRVWYPQHQVRFGQFVPSQGVQLMCADLLKADQVGATSLSEVQGKLMSPARVEQATVPCGVAKPAPGVFLTPGTLDPSHGEDVVAVD